MWVNRWRLLLQTSSLISCEGAVHLEILSRRSELTVVELAGGRASPTLVVMTCGLTGLINVTLAKSLDFSLLQ